MFDKIITVCLNPAIDISLWLDRYDINEPVNAIRDETQGGGKAVNVSRVLKGLGLSSHAIALAGHDNLLKFTRLLQEDNIDIEIIECDGETRENYSITLPTGGMLKINRKSYFDTKGKLSLVEQSIKKGCHGYKNVALVFASSIPVMLNSIDLKKLILRCKAPNVNIILDTTVFNLSDIIEISPFMIKPNKVELEEIAKCKLRSTEKIAEFAKKLTQYVKYVLVSVGADGILLSTANGTYLSTPPIVRVKSTVGAGDTALAGFLFSLNFGHTDYDACTFAAACGTSSVTLDGTQIITPIQVDTILSQVVTERIM